MTSQLVTIKLNRCFHNAVQVTDCQYVLMRKSKSVKLQLWNKGDLLTVYSRDVFTPLSYRRKSLNWLILRCRKSHVFYITMTLGALNVSWFEV